MTISNREIRLLYGANAIISRRAPFVLVHLDRPSREVVRARTREFDPDRYFDPQCPICCLQREGGIVVFDDYSTLDEEEILME